MRIRPLDPKDLPAVVQLSLRSWAPNYVSLEAAVGSDVYQRLHPDWRVDQQRDVETTCSAPGMDVWVADVDGVPVGFVAVELRRDRREGEIHMLAVDPGHQNMGIGRALTEHAIAWIKAADMTLAIVETGGDPGHEAARHTYEEVGFTKLPIARYFMTLGD